MASLKETLQAYNTKVIEKLNYLHELLEEVAPWMGLSPDAGNSLTTDADGKLYYKERTAAEIKEAYESNDNTEAFTTAHKSTIEAYGEGLEGKVDKDPATGKVVLSQLPALSITNKVVVAESSLAAFLVNVDAYTFEEGDVIVLRNLDGELENYLYLGGNNTLEENYGPISDVGETAESIKMKYESNPDTEAFTTAEKNKLAGLTGEVTDTTTRLLSLNTNWQKGTLNYNPYSEWMENGVKVTFSGERTAVPDATYGRFALWYLDLLNDTVELKHGVASENPERPSVDDPVNHLDTGVFIFLPAGATVPDGVTGETVYAEGAVGEYAISGTGTINTADTNPYSGTYNIEALLNDGQYIEFTAPAALSSGELAYKLQNIVGGSHHIIFIGTAAKNGRPGSWTVGSPGNYSASSTEYQFQSVSFPSELSSITSFRIVSGVNGLNIRLDDMYVISGGGSVVGGYATKEELAAVEADVADHETRITALEAGGGGGSSAPVSRTGTNIVFTADALYNEITPLTAGDLTLDLTGAVKGALSIVYCDRYIPEILGEDYLISGNLSSSKLNELWFFWNGTYIDLMVINKTYIAALTGVNLVPGDSVINLTGFQTLNASSYEILFSTTDDIDTASAVPGYNGTDTFYEHSGLTNGTIYYYWIRAIGKGFLPSEYAEISGTPVSWDKTGLVSFFNNDETSGTTGSDAHGSNDAALNDIAFGPGRIGGGFEFNGSSSFVEYPGLLNSFTGSFSVLVWFKTTVPNTGGSGSRRLLQNRGEGVFGTMKGWAIMTINEGWSSTGIDDGNGNYIGVPNSLDGGGPAFTQNDDQWHQAGITWDTTTGEFTFYIDGVVKHQETNPAMIGISMNALDVLAGKSNQDSQYFQGSQDLVSFWSKALTSEDVAEHYNNGNGKNYETL